MLEAAVGASADGETELTTESGLRLRTRCAAPPASRTITVLVRPERVRIVADGGAGADGVLPAEIRSMVYLGDDAQFQLLVDGRQSMLATMKAHVPAMPRIGERMHVRIDPGDVFVIPR